MQQLGFSKILKKSPKNVFNEMLKYSNFIKTITKKVLNFEINVIINNLTPQGNQMKHTFTLIKATYLNFKYFIISVLSKY